MTIPRCENCRHPVIGDCCEQCGTRLERRRPQMRLPLDDRFPLRKPRNEKDERKPSNEPNEIVIEMS